jgi:hypothetical protein
MRALIPLSQRNRAFWWSAFLSPTAYFLLLLLADSFHFPSAPDAVVAGLFYLIPPAALLVCGSAIRSSGMAGERKVRWMIFTLLAMLAQVGVLLAVSIVATG